MVEKVRRSVFLDEEPWRWHAISKYKRQRQPINQGIQFVEKPHFPGSAGLEPAHLLVHSGEDGVFVSSEFLNQPTPLYAKFFP